MKLDVKNPHLTSKIMLAMFLGILVGTAIKFIPDHLALREVLSKDILKTGGDIFINILKMLVVPVVFVSIVCGSSSLEISRLGKVGGKTLVLYLFTTALAIGLALFFANLFGIGKGAQLSTNLTYTPNNIPGVKEILVNLVPHNPFTAFAQGDMLQIIIFSLLLGIGLSVTGNKAQKVRDFFNEMNEVVMNLILLVMKVAPYGIFCLIAHLFSKMGFGFIVELLGYFSVVLFVLFIHLFVSYSLLLNLMARLNPLPFFKKMYAVMLFAFSTSSSNATLPLNLETVEKKLGVDNSIASFVVPLGATVNMDGTAIMQGVATVFIAHVYGVHIGFSGYLLVMLMATLASIGTAGVPSVGLITLAMVLKQVNVPVEGIALIIGIDRLLDMARTAVNVTGDAVVACIVGKTEKAMDENIYKSTG